MAEDKPTKAPTTLGRRSTDGAWVTYERVISHEPDPNSTEQREYIHVAVGIYPDKDDAGDAIIDGPGDHPRTLRRIFVPWGWTLQDAIREAS